MDSQKPSPLTSQVTATRPPPGTSQSIEWYAVGQARTVEVDGILVTVRLVERRNQRARILITAPAGAVFCSADSVDSQTKVESHNERR